MSSRSTRDNRRSESDEEEEEEHYEDDEYEETMTPTSNKPSLTIVSSSKKIVKKRRSDTANAPPYDAKRTDLRACMICSLVKDQFQFEEEGCDNCEAVLHLAGSGSVDSYTSKTFEGMIALVNPEDSWIAKWQHISNLKKGAYAASVKGELPMSLKSELMEAGFQYHCRDKGLTEEEVEERERIQNPDDFEDHRKLKRNRRRKNKNRGGDGSQDALSGGNSTASASSNSQVIKGEDSQPEDEEVEPNSQ